MRAASPHAEALATAAVRRGDLEATVTATGKIEPRAYVDLGAQASGQLRRILVHVGDFVEQGQLLAEIDPQVQAAKVEADDAQLNANLVEQQANVEYATDALERYAKLVGSDSIARPTCGQGRRKSKTAAARAETIRAQILQMQSTLKADQVALGYTRIIRADVRKGGLDRRARGSDAQRDLFDAADPAHRRSFDDDRLDASVGSRRHATARGHAGLFHHAGAWRPALDRVASPDSPGPAEAGPTGGADANTQPLAQAGVVVLYTALFDVDNAAGDLRPEMTAQVFFVAAEARGALIVPLAIMGQSGSGKSTLMNILGCLDKPGGVYRFAGRDVATLSRDDLARLRREAFGFVFQQYNLIPTITAAENVEIPATYAGLAPQERRARAAELLGRLGLAERLDHRPTQLSGAHGGASIVSDMREALHAGGRALSANPFRTALTLLGVVIGVASVIALLAIGEGARAKVLTQLAIFGTNRMYVIPGGESSRGPGGRLIASDADLVRETPNVAAAMPYLHGAVIARSGEVDYPTDGVAVTTNFPLILHWSLDSGVFFAKQDERSLAAVAVLGSKLAGRMFPDGSDPVGKMILVNNVPFEVIGVLSSKGALSGDGDDAAIVFPFSTGDVRVFGRQELSWISVLVDDLSQADQTEAAIGAVLESAHRLRDFRIYNKAATIEAQDRTQHALTLLLGFTAAISLLVGDIGVMNVMLMTVSERTGEIGVRMATGARTADILRQFLTEAMIVAGAGGLGRRRSRRRRRGVAVRHAGDLLGDGDHRRARLRRAGGPSFRLHARIARGAA